MDVTCCRLINNHRLFWDVACSIFRMHVAQGGKLLRFRKWRERTPPKRRQTPIDAVSCTGRLETLPGYPLLQYILYLVTHCYSTNSSRYFSWLYILILYHFSLYFDVVCCCELRFPTRKNLSKNYPRIFSGPSKRFASPGIHRNSLKNIGLKGCQIISLPGAPNY